MTKTIDGNGKALTLPEDLRVCECHQCRRLAVSRRIGPSHAEVVRPLIKQGLMGRLSSQNGNRPTCDLCRRLLKVMGVRA